MKKIPLIILFFTILQTLAAQSSNKATKIAFALSYSLYIHDTILEEKCSDLLVKNHFDELDLFTIAPLYKIFLEKDNDAALKKVLKQGFKKGLKFSNLAEMEGDYTKLADKDWFKKDFLSNKNKIEKQSTTNVDLEQYAALKVLNNFDQFLRTTAYLTDSIQRYKFDHEYVSNMLFSFFENNQPTQQSIGGLEGIITLWVTLLHQADYPDNFLKIQDKQILEYCLKKQILNPYMYATILDRYYLSNYNYQIYGTEYDSEKNDELYLIKDIKEVDSRRLKIGLLPLKYAYDLARKGIKMPLDYDEKNVKEIEYYLKDN